MTGERLGSEVVCGGLTDLGGDTPPTVYVGISCWHCDTISVMASLFGVRDSRANQLVWHCVVDNHCQVVVK